MKVKNKKCIECGREDQPWFSKKRCKFCAQKSYKSPSKNTKSKASMEKQVKRDRLTEFFDSVSEMGLENRCEETGVSIGQISRVNIAHILPKRKYESVMCSKNNFIILSWQAHTDFDGYLDRVDLEGLESNFPNTWPKVLAKVKLMIESGEVKEGGKLIWAFEEIIKN